jgi:hypothetical protein
VGSEPQPPTAPAAAIAKQTRHQRCMPGRPPVQATLTARSFIAVHARPERTIR